MGPTNANSYFDSKWSGVASMSYVRSSHSFKIGGEYQINSWTDRNTRGAQGILNYQDANNIPVETGPSTSVNGIALASGQSGLGYASFLLGAVNNASVNAIQDPQWRGYKGALVFPGRLEDQPQIDGQLRPPLGHPDTRPRNLVPQQHVRALDCESECRRAAGRHHL